MARPLVQSAPLTGFRDTVRELGGDPEELITRVGINPLVCMLLHASGLVYRTDMLFEEGHARDLTRDT